MHLPFSLCVLVFYENIYSIVKVRSRLSVTQKSRKGNKTESYSNPTQMIFASQYGIIDKRFTQNFKANSENSKSVRIKRTALNLRYAHITSANSLD